MTSNSLKSLSDLPEKLMKPQMREKSFMHNKAYISQDMEIIFVFCPLPEKLKNQLRDLAGKGHTVIFADGNEQQTHPEFHRSTILFGNPPREWLNVAENLRFWQLDSAGFAVYADVSTGARVCNMGRFFSRPCAETLIGGLLALYRKLNVFILAGTNKQWIGKEIRHRQDTLSGKNIIMLGAGNIARETAHILKAFACNVKFLARTNPNADYRNKEELYRHLHEFDLVINTLPGTANKYVDAEFFEKMKKGSVYANIGRGITTDEEALWLNLQSGKLSGAVLDVNTIEPLPPSSPLWNQENIILSHHNGGGIYVEFEAKLKLFLDNLKAFQNGYPLKNQIDLKKGY